MCLLECDSCTFQASMVLVRQCQMDNRHPQDRRCLWEDLAVGHCQKRSGHCEKNGAL